MRRFMLVIMMIVLSGGLSGCTKEDPTPEERDPIYKDLERRYNEHTKAAEERKAALEELYKTLEKAEPNSIERKDVQRDIAKTKSQLLEADQWSRYYKIRMGRRKIVDRMAYKEAFDAKKEWPYPGEYSEYQTNRRLVESSRNWNLRVPKLQDRVSSATSAAEPKKDSGGGGH